MSSSLKRHRDFTRCPSDSESLHTGSPGRSESRHPIVTSDLSVNQSTHDVRRKRRRLPRSSEVIRLVVDRNGKDVVGQDLPGPPIADNEETLVRSSPTGIPSVVALTNSLPYIKGEPVSSALSYDNNHFNEVGEEADNSAKPIVFYSTAADPASKVEENVQRLMQEKLSPLSVEYVPQDITSSFDVTGVTDDTPFINANVTVSAHPAPVITRPNVSALAH
ncbi:hypothetical protein HDU93_006350 [Gonapodya sp. JEL0774]|nr:hypothetical protein HDU93_006350 [Gonapodya sp. JEL0774]